MAAAMTHSFPAPPRGTSLQRHRTDSLATDGATSTILGQWRPKSSGGLSVSVNTKGSDEDQKTAVNVVGGLQNQQQRRSRFRGLSLDADGARNRGAYVAMDATEAISIPHSFGHCDAASEESVVSMSPYSSNQLTSSPLLSAIRLRPPLPASDPNYDSIPARFRKSCCQVGNSTSLLIDSAKVNKLFVFDRVLPDTESQEGVWEYVSPVVDSFVQGYNVSLLAYGQSGAGKSYTMGTSEPDDQEDASSTGIIPRAAAALFDKLDFSSRPKQTSGSGLRMPTRYSTQGLPNGNSHPKEERSWQLKATYVEIYNEQLRDLLVPDTAPLTERPSVTIREDTRGRIILAGLKSIPINSIEDLMSALHMGSSIRQTDATGINSKSSRSHAVFSLNLVQKRNRPASGGTGDKRSSTNLDAINGDSIVTIDSKLHFVDLAGSERLKNSGLTGDRVKEGISINAGLASLGKVISQLSSRAPGAHVSYRDSRLTRMLQDSLGGNAITYMIACVNPVEFHLSETLNTVQYAQRARAIQIRPQIQQRSDDSDKQLIIERLRAEIKFLREQIRSSQHSDRRKTSSSDRSRTAERENELQNQLLDIQENYSALSHRHAKLISELAKGKNDDTANLPRLQGALGYKVKEAARSKSFAEQVELVILEYEKTIQSLEASLSTSRSSLATSEGHLLEREAKIVYHQALIQQLQTRLSKAMDREQSGESYLKDLEDKLDSVNTGEEKQNVVMRDLRNEVARLRESEISSEEYISTIEERLAEAEQDTEVMQREIERLERVIERQRSVGKLDNLLSELDNLGRDGAIATNGTSQHAVAPEQPDFFHDRLVATASAHHPHEELAPASAEEEWKTFGPMEGEEDVQSQYTSTSFDATRGGLSESPRPPLPHLNGDEKVHSPAQAKAIADKLETMTMELFDLRGEHEGAVAELNDVSRKYEIALSTLAELQDAVAGGRQSGRTQSFLEQRAIPDSREDERRASSRMLSSDLSSRGPSPTLVDASDAGTLVSDSIPNGDYRPLSKMLQKEETLAESIRALRRSNAEKDISINELTENYSQLEDQHRDTLKYIDELKEEMQRLPTPSMPPASLSPTMGHTIGRRRSNLGVQRESRVFAVLQNLAVEHLQSRPELLKTFETNLGDAVTESQLRQERVEALEAENTAAKKELGVKNTMISGLHRERASRSVGPTDVALVSILKDHLVQTHQYIMNVQKSNAAHQERLLTGVRSFSTFLGPQSAVVDSAADGSREVDDAPGVFPGKDSEEAGTAVNAAPTSELRAQLESWNAEHKSTFEAVQALEQQLARTVAGLEVSLRNAENLHRETADARDLRNDIHRSEVPKDLAAEREIHANQIQAMEAEIAAYKSKARDHADKVKHLETSFDQIMKEAKEDAQSRDLTVSELQTHRELVANLEDQLDQQKSLTTFHQQGLKSLEEQHLRELNELSGAMSQQRGKHVQTTQQLEHELTKAHMEIAALLQGVSVALEEEADPSSLQARIQTLADDRKSISAKHTVAAEALVSAQRETEAAKQEAGILEAKVNELAAMNEETLKQLEKTVEKEQKSSQLVQVLEEQLNSNYDQYKESNLRLSTSQKERADVERELEDSRGRVSSLEVQLTEMKRMTNYSHNSEVRRESTATDLERGVSLRKSASQISILNSPPPAVPLPPLPAPQSPRPDTAVSRPPSQGVGVSTATTEQQNDSALADVERRLAENQRALIAERKLTSTLEEALMDLETSHNQSKASLDDWRVRFEKVEGEARGLRDEKKNMRNSIQQLEAETTRRKTAEEARKRLEEQMAQLGEGRRKKKGASTLNCF